MIYRSHPWKELLHPNTTFGQLKEAERVKRVIPILLLFLFFSAVLSFVRAYIGVGTEELAKYLPATPMNNERCCTCCLPGAHRRRNGRSVALFSSARSHFMPCLRKPIWRN